LLVVGRIDRSIVSVIVDGRRRVTCRAMTIAVLTGGRGPLGTRVERMLSNDAIDVYVLDDTVHPSSGSHPNWPDAADVVIDLGTSDYDRRAERRESASEFVTSSLAAADRFAADQIVFVSSVLVYGAAPNNPKPLTEDAVLRPDVEFVFARQLASAEELVDEWRRARRGRVTSVLRPALSLAENETSRLAAAVVSGLGRRVAEADPPSQFLHLDDLATAIVIAVRQRLDVCGYWRGSGHGSHFLSACLRSSRRFVGDSSAARCRRGCVRTRVSPGSCRTVGCVRRAGNRR
jgi:nucleoside-diphosphate-sugar epimerase